MLNKTRKPYKAIALTLAVAIFTVCLDNTDRFNNDKRIQDIQAQGNMSVIHADKITLTENLLNTTDIISNDKNLVRVALRPSTRFLSHIIRMHISKSSNFSFYNT